MLRPADLLRIVVRRQLRQLRIGIILSISIGIAMYMSVNIIGKDIEDRVGGDVALLGGVTILEATLEENLHPANPPMFFTEKTVEAIRREPDVLSVTTAMRERARVFAQKGERRFDIPVMGVGADYWDVYSIVPSEGRLLDIDDEKKRSRVCVLGVEMAEWLFGKGPYVGKVVNILNDNYTVVGISSGIMASGKILWCFIPMTTAMDRGFPDAYPNVLLVRLHHLDKVEYWVENLPKLIVKYQKAPFLRIEYGRAQVGNVRKVINLVHTLLQLGIVASLGLGSFGIWHSSFASVRERTREIGLKLAMGAEQRDITMQFLGEALCIALLGGLAGIAVGIFAVATLSLVLDLSFPILQILLNIPICLIAASIVGAVGGVYPAMQAGRMDVAVALRFE